MDFIGQYATISLVVLVTGIVVLVKTLRQLLEMLVPRLKKQATELEPKAMYLGKLGLWWHEFILPRMPVLVGALLVLVDRKFFGGENFTTFGSVMVYGGCVGWFSGTIYNGIRKAVAKTVGVTLPDSISRTSDTDPAPPITDENS